MASKTKKKIYGALILLVFVIIGIAVIKKVTSPRVSLSVDPLSIQQVSYEEFADYETKPIQYDEEIYGHTKIAESEQYELFLYEPTLSILLRDKESGAIMESTLREDDGENNNQWIGFMSSGVVINVIEGVNDTVQADFINNSAEITVTLIANGFHAMVTFTEFDFSFEMTVSLKGDSIVVEIPDEKINENSTKYLIGAINVYPFLGYSYLGEKEGYMLIPDGNGALIYLEDKEGRFKGGYSQLIYGEDIGFKDSTVESLLWGELQMVNSSENILAPVFGMVHTSDGIGYLGIVESGMERASIEAYPNGVTVNYNRIYAKFLKRKVYVQPTSQSNSGSITQVEKDRTHTDIRVRYCFVREENADYTGLAVRFRDYLLDEGGLERKDTNYQTRIDFLGSEREEGLVFKKPVGMTSVEQIKSIYQELKEAGVTDVLSLYKGWQSGGINALPVVSYKADSSIGSTKDLTQSINAFKEDGISFYLYQDYLRINPDETNTTFNVVKRVDKRLYEEYVYMEVYNRFLYLTPKRSKYLLEGLAGEFLKEGIDQIALAGISNTIYSYSYSGDYYTRKDTSMAYEEIVAGLDETFEVLLEQPFAYLWNYSKAYIDMPIGSSNYLFIDEEVPFLTTALKGILPMYSEYVNFEANKHEFFLHLVEMGVYPSFYITFEDSSRLIYTNSSDIYSSKYSIYKEDIVRYSKEFKAIYDVIKDALIISHERLDNGITKVGYDNGVIIYLNYTQQELMVDDDVIVPAMSYKVGEAK